MASIKSKAVKFTIVNSLCRSSAPVLFLLGLSSFTLEASAFLFGNNPGLPNGLRGGGPPQSQATELTPEEIKRLPWFVVLELSPLRLGSGPYGLPYFLGKPNIKHTLWESNPKRAMCQTLLNLAEDNGPVEQAEKLLRIGADPNYQHPTEQYTSLHAAALRGNTRLLQVLVSKGGDLKKKASFGTPLDVARKYKRSETVQWIESVLKK